VEVCLRPPLTPEVAVALSRFFKAGGGPSHLEIDEVLRSGEIAKFDPRTSPRDPIGREVRIRVALGSAARAGGNVNGEGVVQDLLTRMRVAGCFDPATEDHYGGEQAVRAAMRACSGAGWAMDETGYITPAVLPNISDPGMRPALDQTVARLRRAGNDSALLIGEAKSLLEATAKYVLAELQFPCGYQDFSQLLHFARERVGLLPDTLDGSNVIGKQLQRVYGRLWSIVSALAELRNSPEGTGHGHLVVPGLDPETAVSVVQAAALLAGLMLRGLDRQLGRE
jgi:hypothetical protein